jgi:antitoxin MazE
MRTQIAKWGDSLAVLLPRQVAESAGLGEGATVDLDVVDGVVRLTAARPRYTLEELLAQITPENLPTEIFDDGPHGQELL